MKLIKTISKTSWIILAIGVFIITSTSLGAVYIQQVNKKNQLNEELTVAEVRLNGFQQEVLETQLGKILSQLETDRATLSQPVGSIAITDTLFDVAQDYTVEIIWISSTGLISTQLEGIPCSGQPITMEVEGSVHALVGFITNLGNYLGTAAVQSIAISVPEMTSGQEPSANIQLVVYTYQGE